MGVHGLWKLIEPSGKPVPLETLENKVLAVDVSIWLHQCVKGFQDTKGAPLPNAHLLGIYHRVCKLLYFKIKPIFVFDGGVPALKRQTIAKRSQLKCRNQNEADRIQKQLINTLLKHSAISNVISEKTKATIKPSSISPTKSKQNSGAGDDLYFLPSSQDATLSSSSDEEVEDSDSQDNFPSKNNHNLNIHNIDTESKEFKALPADVRYDILSEVKETRKQSSWGRIHELPTQSNDFSSYQMSRLLQRQTVQAELEKTEKEMGGHSLSLAQLESLLQDQGVLDKNEVVGRKLASDENTKFLFIKDVKDAIEIAKQKQNKIIEDEEEELPPSGSESEKTNGQINKESNSGSKPVPFSKVDIEYEEDLQKAIELSLKDKENENLGEDNCFELNDSDSDDEIDLKSLKNTMSSAQSYMMEYSGLTPNEIMKIIKKNNLKNENETKQSARPPNANLSDTNTLNQNLQKSATASNNFPEEIEKTTVEFNSDSDDSEDFVDVPEEKNLEVVIEPAGGVDDLFSDIFNASDNEKKSENVTDTEVTNINNKSMETDTATLPSQSESLLEHKINETPNKENDKVKITSASSSSSKTHTIDVVKDSKQAFHIPIEKNDVAVSETQNRDNELELPQEPRIENPVEAVTKEKSDADNDNVSKLSLQNSNQLETNKNTPEVLVLVDEQQSENLRTDSRKPKLTVEEMEGLKDSLRKEQLKLETEKASKERLASNITDQMYQESQELLELFGIPYITAPMEAEAQCAFLDAINMTDGTITDDSDIWLFGGTTVYKNFFNQSKHVLEFRAEQIYRNFKLTREQMILLALLVGSDYTIGISGVGPVTALEILAAFPPPKVIESASTLPQQLLSGLSQFRSWYTKGKIPGPSRNSLRSKLRNAVIADGFPNTQVVQAYLEPKVESSREAFSWAKPDIVGLTDFARRKFGWTLKKSEEILKPVIKRLEENQIQKSIKDYFKTKTKITHDDVEEKMSKRVKTAVKRIGQEDVDEEPKEKKPRKRKADIPDEGKGGKATKRKRVVKKKQEDLGELEHDEDVKILKSTEERSGQRVEEINTEVMSELKDRQKKIAESNLRKKELIPQKERAKANVLRSKLRAIEIFRKSKKGPGYVKKRTRTTQQPKDDANLSESSSDE